MRFIRPELAVGCACLAVALLGCQRRAVERGGGRGDSVAESRLHVMEGAVDVRRGQTPDGGDRIEYGLEVAYPATAVTDAIQARAKALSAIALEHEYLNPDLPGQTDWSHFIDSSKQPQTFVHVWNGEWLTTEGDVMSYSLTYVSAAPRDQRSARTPDNSRLHVMAMLVPASAVLNTRANLGIAGPPK